MAAVSQVRILVAASLFKTPLIFILETWKKKLSTKVYFLAITRNFEKHHKKTLFYLKI